MKLPASALTVWVIYNSPRDHPGKWVLRAQDANRDGVRPHDDCYVCESLEQARAYLPWGVVKLARHPEDDPVIYETWV
jgi:hypothetical protein